MNNLKIFCVADAVMLSSLGASNSDTCPVCDAATCREQLGKSFTSSLDMQSALLLIAWNSSSPAACLPAITVGAKKA
jgi:hypothetical protein